MGPTVFPVFGGRTGGVYPMPEGLRNPQAKIPGSVHKINVPRQSSDIIACISGSHTLTLLKLGD